jgi:hypothetical protein
VRAPLVDRSAPVDDHLATLDDDDHVEQISHRLEWIAIHDRGSSVFAIEIETCQRCGGRLRVVASIEDPALIQRILAQRERGTEDQHPHAFTARAPPQSSLF